MIKRSKEISIWSNEKDFFDLKESLEIIIFILPIEKFGLMQNKLENTWTNNFVIITTLILEN